MSNISLEHDTTIYQEMMTHPALFSHLKPLKAGIIGDQDHRILSETQKHAHLEEIWSVTKQTDSLNNDPRVKFCHTTELSTHITPNSLDILIITEDAAEQSFSQYFHLLTTDGVLVQLADSPFQVQALKKIQDELKSAGFRDIQTLNFPQPNFASGWRSAMMAKKHGIFRKIREKDIFNKIFQTHYYNFDVHKAALVLPEFMRQELAL